jgi:D-glycero-D-manno-heptose 1,7-bisphosphate phosphatase
MVMGARAVFLDRDGVLVVPQFRDGRSFAPTTIEAFRIDDAAPECLGSLKQAGFLLVVVTNQPDLGNGLIAPAVMDEMNRRIRAALPIDDVRVCPHRQDEHCDCRKPSPGMLVAAAAQLGIALSRSFMVGDRASDIAAGRAAGCRTVFLDLDYTAEPKPEDADFSVRSLRDATACILAANRNEVHHAAT